MPVKMNPFDGAAIVNTRVIQVNIGKDSYATSE